MRFWLDITQIPANHPVTFEIFQLCRSEVFRQLLVAFWCNFVSLRKLHEVSIKPHIFYVFCSLFQMISQSLQNFRSQPISQQNLRHFWEAQAWFQTGMRPKVIGLASSHQMWRSTLPWKRRSMSWQRHVICLFRMTTQSLRYDSFLNEQIKFCFNCFQDDIPLGTSDMIIMWLLSSRVIMRKSARRIQMKMVICHCCGQRNVPLPTQPNSCWS